MTCIVGFVDRENKITYLGGDSLAVSGWKRVVLQEHKVFKLQGMPNAMLGFSGMVRDMNLLTYAVNLMDKRDEPNIDSKYIIKTFIPNVIKLLEDSGRNITDNGIKESESYFLLAYKDRLWKVSHNYDVISVNEYESIGCGNEFALGSLATTDDMELSPIERVHLALQAASKFSAGVGGPFYIINTGNDVVLTFES